MDPRRLLTLSAIAFALCGCSHLQRLGGSPSAPATPGASAAVPVTAGAPEPAAPPTPANPPIAEPALPPARTFATMAPIPNPGRGARARTSPSSRAPAASRPEVIPRPAIAPSGRDAIAAANHAARQLSRARGFVGGVQVFAYDPGQVYEVWTAPLRVTTLTLSRGESVISKAAGDTVRWQIGETQSGEGPDQRAHVMIKPLARGLETNLVLATNRRVYLVQLRSGDPDAFNAAVTWDLASMLDAPTAAEPVPGPAPLVTPQGPMDAAFKIRPRGRRPDWTPSAVATDGVRTFLSFPARMTAAEAPALFALGPGGEAQLVNYRQQGTLWVVDRVLRAAELRRGGKRPEVVRIERIGGAS